MAAPASGLNLMARQAAPRQAPGCTHPNACHDEPRARDMNEIARNPGAKRLQLARKAGALRRSARALTEGAEVRLGQPIIHDPTSRIWWVILLRALAAIAFGALTLAWPRHSAQALLGLFGAYAVFDGLVLFLMTANLDRRRPWLTLRATINVVVGVVALTQPELLALLLVRVLGGWLILHGAAEIICEPALRGADAASKPHGRRDLGVLLNGAMSALFGVALIAAPKVGALSLLWAIGIWAVLHGLLMLPLAARLRAAGRSGLLA
ncbi:HdeD family acid-resistance protein [Phenylobacterium terrae]|uniref:HdeD family acid-resistance protein n=1 Tax=Phenylobacterium terrae TaxID=2665495 RepID=A0ABW4N457_9CAUL